jgi:hypothetical protein
MSSKGADVNVKNVDGSVIVIESQSGTTILQQADESVLDLESDGLVSDSESGCRIAIENLEEDTTFYESEYIDVLTEAVILLAEMYDIQPYKVIEPVERNLLHRDVNNSHNRR